MTEASSITKGTHAVQSTSDVTTHQALSSFVPETASIRVHIVPSHGKRQRPSRYVQLGHNVQIEYMRPNPSRPMHANA